MLNLFLWWLAGVACLFRAAECTLPSPAKVWNNVEYQKLIDVKHAYINEAVELTIENISGEPVDEYYFALQENVYDKVSLFAVKLGDKNVFLNSSLHPGKSELEDGTMVGYGLVKFPSPIAPNERVSISVRISHNAFGIPHPSRISIAEEQSLLLRTPRLPFSAYFTKKGNLKVIGSPRFGELDAVDDSSLNGKEIEGGLSFGSWKDVEPLETKYELKLVYSHNLPIIEASRLKRDVWVSHWASTIQFEEYYEIINHSAELDKGFSRLELMKDQRGMKLSHYCSVLEMNLPEQSTDHYYTDLVGKVSTSRVLGDHFYLKPRYPLFGGWKYNFTIGWTNKLSNFLHKQRMAQDTYILSIPLLNGPTDTMYNEVELSVLLPEGAQVLAVDPPIPFIDIGVTNQRSYLDLNTGHVKVTCNFKNLIDEIGNGQVLVKYRYDTNSLYKKPLSIALYIFVALMSFFLLRSFNLSMDKN
ncbi:hypothetical protein HG536_0E04250 [Torulaspora globosa]|uniref:Dolichyl-diphosphooligosaccharide--protein glycosyltransferase subunit 1 n=1 Tax=Torulaspora globosa TaxID=48254 RepID=A0A7G3ZJ28_9SACH|nr:uncharacterized protein HG536_0E04250 [Torulaspora globosa]QLL33514.1 hypothetical protein HG536_0E04250 [Torulaspora globosa]